MITPKMIHIMRDFEWYFDNGYITQRDGNACLKLDDGRFLVTASGVEKQAMTTEDYVILEKTIEPDMEIYYPIAGSQNVPSIETEAHIYSLLTTHQQASVHVHSPNTVALFELFAKSKLRPDLVKALNTNWPELFRYTKVGATVPFLEPGSQQLHDSIVLSFNIGLTNEKHPDIVVMERHGVIANGKTLDECKEHIVRCEHISTILLKMISASGGRLEVVL